VWGGEGRRVDFGEKSLRMSRGQLKVRRREGNSFRGKKPDSVGKRQSKNGHQGDDERNMGQKNSKTHRGFRGEDRKYNEINERSVEEKTEVKRRKGRVEYKKLEREGKEWRYSRKRKVATKSESGL